MNRPSTSKLNLVESSAQHEVDAAKTKPRKRPNYLEHEDHCCIIKRVARGETQAALAREFGVTRAAVNKLYKKRKQILSREEEEKLLTSETPEVKNPESDVKVHPRTVESSSKMVKLLLKKLQDPRTSLNDYRRAAARLKFILVEEVLERHDIQEGVTEFCAITLGDESASFLTAFGQIDPEAPTGQIYVRTTQDNDCLRWELHYLDVPDSIANLRVLLFSTSGSGGAECKAIEALRRISVQEHRISVIMVVCSLLGYEEISGRYSNVTIIVASIDAEWTLEGGLRSDNVGARAVISP